MSWRIKVVHRSVYHYSSAVTSSYNEARITPLTTPTQLVLDAAVEVSPTARCAATGTTGGPWSTPSICTSRTTSSR